MVENSNKIKVLSAQPLEPNDQALLAFGKQVYAESVNVHVSYGKTMITLISGFFAAYFALLKFLGIDNISSVVFQSLPGIGWTPILFILAIVVFVVGVVLPLPQFVSLNDLSNLKIARKRLITIKYIFCLVGTGFFLSGLVLTMQIGITLLS